MNEEAAISDVQELLVKLWNERAAMQRMLQKKQKKIELAMKPVKLALDKIERSFVSVLERLGRGISELETEIKERTLEHGKSISGDDLIAIYQPGKRSVNMDTLEGLALAIPAVKEIIKQGDAYVQINPRPGHRLPE